MIRHVVLVRFRADVPDAERLAIRDALRPEGLQRGLNAGFTIDFADAAARDAYLADPGHAAAGARLVAAAEGGVDGLVVVDLDLG